MLFKVETFFVNLQIKISKSFDTYIIIYILYIIHILFVQPTVIVKCVIQLHNLILMLKFILSVPNYGTLST